MTCIPYGISRTNREITVRRDGKGVESAYLKWWQLATLAMCWLYTPRITPRTSFRLWTLVNVGQVSPNTAPEQLCNDTSHNFESQRLFFAE